MRRTFFSAIIFLFIVSFTTLSLDTLEVFAQEKSSEEEIKTVAFLDDDKCKILDDYAGLIEEELLKIAQGRYEIRFVDKIYGEYDKEVIRQKLVELFKNDEVDLIIGLGFMVAAVVVQEKELLKPVILGDIYDINLFDMPYVDGVSGKRNLNYLGTHYKLRNNIRTFRRAVPFKKLHMLIDKVYTDQAEEVLDRAGVLGSKIIIVPYEEKAADTLDAVGTEGVEAVYLFPSDILGEGYNDEIIKGLNEAKIPTFSHIGEEEVEEGVFAGLVPKFYTKFARRVALNADRIFKGEEAGEISVDFDAEYRFVVNARTARQIGISLPYEVLFDAKVLYPFEGWGNKLSIKTAVEEATKNNLLFRIKDEEIKEAKKDHLLKWSDYLPQVGFSFDYDIYDAETANLSRGLTPKWRTRNRYSLSQLIFSDPVLTNIMNSKKEIYIERLSRESDTLDITDETSRDYLNYLITKALLKVEVDNLNATKHNLEMAEKRYKIGVGGKEEIFRWKSEVADRQSNVIKANSDIRMARITLNQLMNHPQETPFQEEDVGMEILVYYIGGSELERFIKNEEMLLVFLEFMTAKAIREAPEIQALKLGIEQQSNVKDTAARKFFLPEATLDGYIDQKLGERYYNTRPQDDHDDWYAGISVTYPIFEGGARGFDYDKQKAELDRLVFKRELAEQFKELVLRKAAYRIYHSLPNIKLSHEAMVNASENYKIMEIKYSKGTISITALIDAQNEKFNREGQSVISVYEFLQDLTAFDRAMSRFHFVEPEEEKKKWHVELVKYFANRGFDIKPAKNI